MRSGVCMTLCRRLDELTENTLEQWAVALAIGEIQLWELPPSVSQLYLFGHVDGALSRQSEIDQLEHLLDVYWARANLTNDQRRERILQRLDAGLQEADAETWDRIESELYEALSARRPNSSNVDLETREAPEIESRNDGNRNAPGVLGEAA